VVSATQARRAFLRFTGFGPDIKAIHIIYGLVERTGYAPGYSVEEGDVSALCAALALAQRRFGVKRVLVVNSFAALPAFAKYAHLLVVSGPVWNGISRYYLDICKAPVQFVEKVVDGVSMDVLLSEFTSHQRCYKTLRENDRPYECYGLVLSGHYPSLHAGPPQTVTVAAGISPLGTFGAVHWLRSLDGRRWKEVFGTAKYFRGEWRYVVVKVIDRSPKGFRSYASEIDTPGFLSLEVVESRFEGHSQ
jgi:hypothetical protein